VLQGRDERQPDRFARPDDGRGISGVARRLGERLEPRHFGTLDQFRGRIRTRRAQPGRQRPASAVFQRGQAGVGGDAVQPGAHGRLSLEAVVCLPGAQQGFLHQVLGIVQRSRHPIAVREQFAPVRLSGGGEIGPAVIGQLPGEHAHRTEHTQLGLRCP
jgi:hypothetical protein